MKRTIISVLLLCVLAWLMYALWMKYGADSSNQQSPITDTWSIWQLLGQNSWSNDQNTGNDVTITSWSLEWFDYEGGGDYKQFFPQTAKQALWDGKDVILYFYSPNDPTDQALNTDIQQRIDRIPLNATILRIDFTTNKSLVESFKVTQQNTIIFLDKSGSERTRRAVGITTLSQIVQAWKE